MYYAITMQSNDVKCTTARLSQTRHPRHPRDGNHKAHNPQGRSALLSCSVSQGATGRHRLGRPETSGDQTWPDSSAGMASHGVTVQLCAARAKKIKKCWNLEALWKKALYWRLAEQVPVQIEVLRRIDCIVNPEPVSFINLFAYWQMMRRGHHSLELECSKGTVFAFATGSPLHTHKVSHVTLTRFMTKRANMWKRWLSGRAKIRCCPGYYHKYACKVIC